MVLTEYYDKNNDVWLSQDFGLCFKKTSSQDNITNDEISLVKKMSVAYLFYNDIKCLHFDIKDNSKFRIADIISYNLEYFDYSSSTINWTKLGSITKKAPFKSNNYIGFTDNSMFSRSKIWIKLSLNLNNNISYQYHRIINLLSYPTSKIQSDSRLRCEIVSVGETNLNKITITFPTKSYINSSTANNITKISIFKSNIVDNKKILSSNIKIDFTTNLNSNNLYNTIDLIDPIIESGKLYDYWVEADYNGKNKLKNAIVYEKYIGDSDNSDKNIYSKTNPISVNYMNPYSSIILSNFNKKNNSIDKILVLEYDANISNIKINRLETVIETLRSKYPFTIRNKEVMYKEFNINGLISFCSEYSDLFYSKEELLNTNLSNQEKYNKNNNISKYNDYKLEQLYREKVLSFLQDGEEKILYSPTEGIMLIRILNVSLTSKKELGRLIYSFTCTAYETGKVVDNFYTINTSMEKINKIAFGNSIISDSLMRYTSDVPIILDNTKTNVENKNFIMEHREGEDVFI